MREGRVSGRKIEKRRPRGKIKEEKWGKKEDRGKRGKGERWTRRKIKGR